MRLPRIFCFGNLQRDVMEIIDTEIRDVKILKPRVFGDERGFFMETWRDSFFRENVADRTFVQDNHSKSTAHVLRGLHYQLNRPQGKLVRVVQGEGSPTASASSARPRSSSTSAPITTIRHPSTPSNGTILRSGLSGRFLRALSRFSQRRISPEFRSKTLFTLTEE